MKFGCDLVQLARFGRIVHSYHLAFAANAHCWYLCCLYLNKQVLFDMSVFEDGHAWSVTKSIRDSNPISTKFPSRALLSFGTILRKRPEFSIERDLFSVFLQFHSKLKILNFVDSGRRYLKILENDCIFFHIEPKIGTISLNFA